MISVLVYHNAAFQELADLTMPHLRRYCARHGYDLTIHCGGFGDRTRLYGFQKTELVTRMLSGCEVLWVLDCDTLITNQTLRLETFMDSAHDFFITKDVNGLNAGSYIAKRTRPVMRFLETTVQWRDQPGMDGEQPAMEKLLTTTLAPAFKVLPQSTINSYLYSEYGIARSHEEGDWRRGDLLLHLPGRTLARRIELFTSPLILDNIIP